MRDELKGLNEDDYWVYGVSVEDFDTTIELINKMLLARTEKFERDDQELRKQYPNSSDYEEVLDDIAHYRYIENQYLWHFGLWRLQGVFESIIYHQLLKNIVSKKLVGLKPKLCELVKAGYELTEDEMKELMSWANLRNTISHAPPEEYRPTALNEEDIIEYKDYVRNLCIRWCNQSEI